MKRIKLLAAACLLILTNATFAQHHHTNKAPVYYIEGKVVNRAYLNFIKPDSIKEMHVVKTDEEHPNGAVYISLKNPEYLKTILADRLLSIKDILNRKGIKVNKNQSLVYVWNDRLLTDTADIRLPESYLRSVFVTPAQNMPYFKTALPNTSVVTIYTDNYDIMIRGAKASR